MILEAFDLALPGRLSGTSLKIEAGQLVCLVGPNGSGKTSLLHAIAGIGSPSGRIIVDGIDPHRLGPNLKPKYLTYLPATRDVNWPLRASDLIALGGAPRDIPELELEGLLDRRVDSLSTGERSRVLIARALVPQPLLLLLDEPTSNLDPLWQFRLMELLKIEIAGGARSVLLAIHDLDLAERYADRILVMDKGGIAAEGLTGAHVGHIFGIERKGGRWEPVSRPADRRTSP